ncbi:MAG: hypothetical protein AAF514_16540, partial [Verrucomicrobiota bacterium]
GRAKGIPTIIFLGQGNSGEHAWIGYMTGDKRWNFEVARVRQENYPVGTAFDPQTWRRITDSEIQYLNRNPTAPASLNRARFLLTWASLNPDQPFYLDLIREARRTAPRDLRIWTLESEVLDERKAPTSEQTRFWQQWISTFGSQKDLKIKGQKRLLNVLEESGDTTGYNRLLKEMVNTTKGQRADLVISLAADRVFAHMEGQRWEEANRTFRGALTKLGRKAGGHLFYELVQPYIQSCFSEGKDQLAAEAVAEAEKLFQPVAGTLLDQDLKQLQTLLRARTNR